MKTLLDKFHIKLGDFWWYSLMLFCAARAADCLNAFVGLYLVPKYVTPSELGAVLPLAQFATFLAIPAAVFAATFRQELTGLALKREFGKMKTLMRGVFSATAVFFFLAIVISRFLLPHFLERIRIVEGSLGFVILATAFISTTAPVYTNALQSLKKFSALSVISILCAPVRLVTMLVMMPFRALTGYFVGQAATPLFTIGASVFALKKELSVPAEPYWDRIAVKRIVRLFLILGISSFAGYAVTLAEATIIRQHLPELDSAAYYLVTRFSDIAMFLSASLMITIFPFAAERSAKGHDNRPLIFKCMLTTVVFGCVLAGFFALFGSSIFRLLPKGHLYTDFVWAVPAMIGVAVINQCGSFFITTETAANRFGFMSWMLPLHLGYIVALLCLTERGYFIDLKDIIGWILGFQAVRLICCILAMRDGPAPHKLLLRESTL